MGEQSGVPRTGLAGGRGDRAHPCACRKRLSGGLPTETPCGGGRAVPWVHLGRGWRWSSTTPGCRQLPLRFLPCHVLSTRDATQQVRRARRQQHWQALGRKALALGLGSAADLLSCSLPLALSGLQAAGALPGSEM